MRGIKLEILGLGVLLLGMNLPSNYFLTYACGVLGFGLAVCGCFYMKDLGERAE